MEFTPYSHELFVIGSIFIFLFFLLVFSVTVLYEAGEQTIVEEKIPNIGILNTTR